MKIVDRATFFSLPKGTIYSKYMPCLFDNFCIKDDTSARCNDWYYQQIVDAVESESSNEWADKLHDAEANGSSMPMDFDCIGRDGLFDKDQLFAVWEPGDVRGLIHRLQRALADVEGTIPEVTPTPVDPGLVQAIYQCVRCDRRIAIYGYGSVGTCSYCGSRVKVTVSYE